MDCRGAGVSSCRQAGPGICPSPPEVISRVGTYPRPRPAIWVARSLVSSVVTAVYRRAFPFGE